MRAILFSTLAVLIIVLSFFLPPSSSVRASEEIIISEINYQGSVQADNCKSNQADRSRCAFDKWIELYNPTNTSINISNWSLRFKKSNTANNLLEFHSNILLPAKQHFLISYKEVNFVPTYSLSGQKADALSGKIRNISNNQEKTIQVELLNKQKESIFSVDLASQTLQALESNQLPNNKYSLEYNLQTGNWENSYTQYYPNNFGSPKSLNGLAKDFDRPEENPQVVPSPVTQKPSPQPEIQKTENSQQISELAKQLPEVSPQNNQVPALQVQTTQEKTLSGNFQNSPSPLTPAIEKQVRPSFSNVKTEKISIPVEKIESKPLEHSKIYYRQNSSASGFNFRILSLDFPEFNQMYVLALTILILGFFYLQNLSKSIGESLNNFSFQLNYT
jgi:hypothetical protein